MPPLPKKGICLVCGGDLVQTYDPFETYHPAEDYYRHFPNPREERCPALIQYGGNFFTLKVDPGYFLETE